MFILDPDFYPSRIPDPNTVIKERGGKKFVGLPFFCSHNFHKIENKFFGMLKKKTWPNFQRIIELFTQKIATKLSKICVWDPEKTIPDPESRGQKGTGSRIQISNTDFCLMREGSGSVPLTNGSATLPRSIHFFRNKF
jgi:hypothetical protein